MQKLRLNPDELHVAQFQIEDGALGGTGTVHGNSVSTQWYTAPCLFCPREPASRQETTC